MTRRPYCARCNGVEFVQHLPQPGTVKPCPDCRRETYERWLAGAFMPTGSRGKPTDERRQDDEAARATVVGLRRALEAPVLPMDDESPHDESPDAA